MLDNPSPIPGMHFKVALSDSASEGTGHRRMSWPKMLKLVVEVSPQIHSTGVQSTEQSKSLGGPVRKSQEKAE